MVSWKRERWEEELTQGRHRLNWLAISWMGYPVTTVSSMCWLFLGWVRDVVCLRGNYLSFREGLRVILKGGDIVCGQVWGGKVLVDSCLVETGLAKTYAPYNAREIMLNICP